MTASKDLVELQSACWGAVALSLQNGRHRVSSRSWCAVGERWRKATMWPGWPPLRQGTARATATQHVVIKPRTVRPWSMRASRVPFDVRAHTRRMRLRDHACVKRRPGWLCVWCKGVRAALDETVTELPTVDKQLETSSACQRNTQ